MELNEPPRRRGGLAENSLSTRRDAAAAGIPDGSDGVFSSSFVQTSRRMMQPQIQITNNYYYPPPPGAPAPTPPPSSPSHSPAASTEAPPASASTNSPSPESRHEQRGERLGSALGFPGQIVTKAIFSIWDVFWDCLVSRLHQIVAFIVIVVIGHYLLTSQLLSIPGRDPATPEEERISFLPSEHFIHPLRDRKVRVISKQTSLGAENLDSIVSLGSADDQEMRGLQLAILQALDKTSTAAAAFCSDPYDRLNEAVSKVRGELRLLARRMNNPSQAAARVPSQTFVGSMYRWILFNVLHREGRPERNVVLSRRLEDLLEALRVLRIEYTTFKDFATETDATTTMKTPKKGTPISELEQAACLLFMPQYDSQRKVIDRVRRDRHLDQATAGAEDSEVRARANAAGLLDKVLTDIEMICQIAKTATATHDSLLTLTNEVMSQTGVWRRIMEAATGMVLTLEELGTEEIDMEKAEGLERKCRELVEKGIAELEKFEAT